MTNPAFLLPSPDAGGVPADAPTWQNSASATVNALMHRAPMPLTVTGTATLLGTTAHGNWPELRIGNRFTWIAPNDCPGGTVNLVIDALMGHEVRTHAGATLGSGLWAAGDRLEAEYDGTYFRLVGVNDDAVTLASNGLPPGYVWGFSRATNASDPNNDIDIGPGYARSIDNTRDGRLSAALTKRLDAVWAQGTNAGCILQSGNLAGTITITTDINVVGTGTAFLTDFVVGEPIQTQSGQCRRVATITSNEAMTVESAWTSAETAHTYKRGGKARNSCYRVFAIRKDSDGTVDIAASTRDTPVDLPSGWSVLQRIMFQLTDGAGNNRQFDQNGAVVLLRTAITHLNAVNYSGGGGTPAVTETQVTQLPPNVRALVHLDAFGTNADSTGATVAVFPTTQAAGTVTQINFSNNNHAYADCEVFLDANSAFKDTVTWGGAGDLTLTLKLIGWVDDLSGSIAGADGAAGANSPDTFRYVFSTALGASDPGSGNLKLNNATQASATALYVSATDADGITAIGTIFDGLGAGTGALKGVVKLAAQVAPTARWVEFEVTAVSGSGTWRTLTLQNGVASAANPLNNGEPLFVSVVRAVGIDTTPFEDQSLTAAIAGKALGDSSAAIFDFAAVAAAVRDKDSAGNITVGAPDAIGTFARSTVRQAFGRDALYHTLAANVIPYAHDAVSRKPLGYEPMPAATRMNKEYILVSGADWSIGNATLTTGQSDSFGGTLGTKFVPNTANAQNFANGNGGNIVNYVSGTRYVAMAIVKAAGYSRILVSLPTTAFGASGCRSQWDIASGKLMLADATVLGGDAIYLGFNTWLIWISAVATATVAGRHMTIAVTDPGAGSAPTFSTTFAGDGTSGIVVMHSEIGPGYAPWPPIRDQRGTTNVAQARDTFTVSLTNLPDLSKGATFIVRAQPCPDQLGQNHTLLRLDDGGNTNRVTISNSTANQAIIRLAGAVGGTVTSADSAAGAFAAEKTLILVFPAAGGCSLYDKSGLISSLSSSEVPAFSALTTLRIGSRITDLQWQAPISLVEVHGYEFSDIDRADAFGRISSEDAVAGQGLHDDVGKYIFKTPDDITGAFGDLSKICNVMRISQTAIRFMATDTVGVQRCYITRADRAQALAMEETRGPIEFIAHNGQSLTQGGGDPSVSITTPPSPHRALRFYNGTDDTGMIGAGGSVWNADAQVDFAPAVETAADGNGESQGSGLMRWYDNALSAAEHKTLLYQSFGRYGWSIAQLNKGTQPYANGLAAMATAKKLAALYGRYVVVPSVHWTQGNQDRDLGTPRATYLAALLQLRADYNTDINGLGMAPNAGVRLFVDQLCAKSDGTAGASDIALAQLDAIETDSMIVPVCPMYHFQGTYGMFDSQHLKGTGYDLYGEYHAKARYDVLEAGLTVTALRPKSFTVSGNVVDVEFWVPVPPIVLDTSTLPDFGNYGFVYSDDQGATIASVAVLNSTTLRITMSANIAAHTTRTLKYAPTDITGSAQTARASVWGNLRDSEPRQSIAVPGLALRNWCFHFTKTF